MRDLSHPNSMDQGASNPFSDDLFVDHPENLPGVTRIHLSAFNRISEAVEDLVVRPDGDTPADSIGRTILVTAPEAGYGKSHLAARLKNQLNAAATAVSLPLDPSRPVAWPVVLGAILRQFSQQASARHEDHSSFAETGRYLLAQLVIQNIESGRAQDCPETVETLRADFVQLLSGDSASPVLGWTDSHSRELIQNIDLTLLKNLGLTETELGFWTRLIIDFNWRGDSALEPLRGLTNGEARERLLQWLRLATFYRPVFIVADGLDGFFQSETAGMEIAGIITGIRESVPRSVTLLCLNNDIWESVFENRLPSAWLDRLTGEPQSLHPLSSEEAAELVKARLRRINLPNASAEEFISQLKTDHFWVDSTLSPRSVLRQARLLWDREGSNLLSQIEEEPEEDYLGEEVPLSELTDKPDFFKALQEDRIPTTPPPAIPPPLPVALENPFETPEPASEIDQPSDPVSPLLHPIPVSLSPPDRTTDLPENPFFSPPAIEPKADPLAGIDSIINDIRDSGKTVVSEPADLLEPESPPSSTEQSDFPSQLQAGDLQVKPVEQDTPSISLPEEPQESGNVLEFPGIPVGFDASLQPEPSAPVATNRASIETRLKEAEFNILNGPPVQLELERVELFVQKMGSDHLGLNQTEERFPSSRTTCLRWKVKGQSVLIGFESPQNVYFWNNLLQQSLSSNRKEKLTAFSHSSESFDPDLFSSFGFSPSVIRGRMDVIEMTDQELAMLYAADTVLTECESEGCGAQAAQYISRNLDPLWRRISKPL